MKRMLFFFLMNYCFSCIYRQGDQNGFTQQADNEWQAALECTPKAQVFEGQGIYGHFEIQSLRNAISMGFQEVFSTADATLFRQNTCKTGNNAIKMSQAFLDIAWFELFTDLNLFKYALNINQNWETDALQILFDGAYFLSADSYGRRRRKQQAKYG